MAVVKDYYKVLGLEPAGSAQGKEWKDKLRKAYKSALLTAHPDKASSQTPASKTGEDSYTVDDVKEALAVLSDDRKRNDHDRWLLTAQGQREGDAGANGNARPATDFVLGLELLDLSDFEASIGYERIDSAPSTPDFDDLENLHIHAHPSEHPEEQDEEGHRPPSTGSVPAIQEPHLATNEEEGERESGAGEMQWTRSCRCGAEQGFRILESELEEAEGRGESEVLVGCEGCSLWVRVGFDVEEG